LKAKWQAGEVTFGCWLSLANTYSAELMARQGYDYACIDLQHGTAEYSDALQMLQAISTTDTPPIVRVPWNEPGIIGRVLDAGAVGVVVPMVNSVEEAEAAVAACRYAPEGGRSFGPIRAAMVHDDYYPTANDQIACIAMIETERAVADIDAILDVPGIDAVYIGPADLSVSLGLPPGVDNDGPFPDALEKVVNACKARGIAPGIHSNAGVAPKRVEGGFQMVTVSSDTLAMAAGARADLKAVGDVDKQAEAVY